MKIKKTYFNQIAIGDWCIFRTINKEIIYCKKISIEKILHYYETISHECVTESYTGQSHSCYSIIKLNVVEKLLFKFQWYLKIIWKNLTSNRKRIEY